MFVGPSVRYFYARKIRQIHKIKSFPYKISIIFNPHLPTLINDGKIQMCKKP